MEFADVKSGVKRKGEITLTDMTGGVDQFSKSKSWGDERPV